MALPFLGFILEETSAPASCSRRLNSFLLGEVKVPNKKTFHPVNKGSSFFAIASRALCGPPFVTVSPATSKDCSFRKYFAARLCVSQSIETTHFPCATPMQYLMVRRAQKGRVSPATICVTSEEYFETREPPSSFKIVFASAVSSLSILVARTTTFLHFDLPLAPLAALLPCLATAFVELGIPFL